MKVASQSNAGDILAVGANAAKQVGQTSKGCDFKTYMQQSGLPETDPVQGTEKTGQTQTARDVHAQTETVKDDRKKEAVQAAEEEQTTEKAEPDSPVGDDEQLTNAQLEAVEEAILPGMLQEQLDTLLTNIAEQLADILGVTQEQLADLMQQMGMEPVDLLDADCVQALVLTSRDAEPVDMLTDEALNALVQEAGSMLEETLANAGLDGDVAALVKAQEGQQAKAEPARSRSENVQPDLLVHDAQQTTAEPELTVDVQQEQLSRDGKEQTDYASMKEQLVNQLNQAVSQSGETIDMPEQTSPARIVEQVVEQIKLTIRQDTTSMELQLYPQHLGKVAIQVSSRNGAVTAQITAENEMARAALEGSIQTLKETFQNQGIKVEAVEIAVATSGFQGEQLLNQQAEEKSSQGSKGNRRIHLDELEETETVQSRTEEENLNIEMMRQEGRSVDFTA